MLSKSNLKTVTGIGFSAAFVAGGFLMLCFGASERDPAWVWALIRLALFVLPVALVVGVMAFLLSFLLRD